MDTRFENKVVIITGAAGGIGKAACLRFSEEKANIVAVDLPNSGVEDMATQLKLDKSRVVTVTADVTSRTESEFYVEKALEHFGQLDVLFNNAGIEGWVGPLVDYPEEIFEKVLAVNVKGVWLGMRAAAPALRSNGGGSIVNTASTAGLGGTPYLIAYGASKHAVVGMTKTAALEFAHENIRVNAICPSPIETRMMRSIERGRNPDSPDDAYRAISKMNPLRRYGEPEEVAALAAFLASSEASYITGGIYPIDGGIKAS
jgi:3alpha(or 20beta)-hydroxysteroid dehydrogenase